MNLKQRPLNEILVPFLGCFQKISDEHPRHFHRGVPLGVQISICCSISWCPCTLGNRRLFLSSLPDDKWELISPRENNVLRTFRKTIRFYSRHLTITQKKCPLCLHLPLTFTSPLKLEAS